MKIKKHWYYITTFCCPMCGKEHVYRERKYTIKPPAASKRRTYHDRYDGCGGY